MTGLELKARRLRFTDQATGRSLTQPQFAQLLNMNPNSIAIMERRGFNTPAQKRYGHLLDLAINWIEHKSKMDAWEFTDTRARKRATDRASSVTRSDELDTGRTRHRPPAPAKGKSKAARAR